MKKFLIQFIALVIIIFAALAYGTGKISNSINLSTNQKNESQKQVKINDLRINVEIADTSEKRKKGLGGRQSLASDSGMLFIFEKSDRHALWMKGMKFPLDFIWIREGKIIDIIKNAKVPDPGTKDQDLPIYLPNSPATAVLEVNSGFVDSHEVKIGDTIRTQ